MDARGGSISRVLNTVDLPLAILDQRDLIVPLREQFRLLEIAARETGDDYFGASLGQAVKSKELSAFGAWVCGAATLEGAMQRAHAGLNAMLQTSTILRTTRHGPRVQWSVEFIDPETEGRRHNEFLALSYAIDMVRVYAGPKWCPDVILTTYPSGTARAPLEDIFGANVSHGHAVPAIELDASLLDRKAFSGEVNSDGARPDDKSPVPDESDILSATLAVSELALQEGYPRIGWVAAKLGTTPRSLQRRLRERDASFNCLVEGVLHRRAKQLLKEQRLSVTDIGLRLGYSDSAHFTRAFRRWTGTSPTDYRKAGQSLVT